MKQQQDVTEKKIVDQKSHVSHERTERQIDGGVKRGIIILKYAELFCMDQEKLLSQILLDNRRLKAMRELAQIA